MNQKQEHELLELMLKTFKKANLNANVGKRLAEVIQARVLKKKEPGLAFSYPFSFPRYENANFIFLGKRIRKRIRCMPFFFKTLF